ncbi:hypothetical protein E0Z10_g7290 [Xylaria hypoxylon]|uniref:Uncharacterized protein n=1 Tax=Xylaria hypoxylon TaxID=37992 RepID=A0A4Z0YSQ7_9PEZI|nr:hypothetical protein E0Z10_g7290 [Xylaria hypoxylon]
MPENTPAQQTAKSDTNTHGNPLGEAADKAQQFAAHKAAPGPAIPQNMPEQEGTKEERQAQAKALNK